MFTCYIYTLPYCSVEVTLIILDDANAAPLSGNQAIRILTNSQSLSALESAGLTANDFTTSGEET